MDEFKPLSEEELAAAKRAMETFSALPAEPAVAPPPVQSATTVSPSSAEPFPPAPIKPIRKRRWIMITAALLTAALGIGIFLAIAFRISGHPNSMVNRPPVLFHDGSGFAYLSDNGTAHFQNPLYAVDESQWRDLVSIDMSITNAVGVRKDGSVIFAGRSTHGGECTHWQGITAISTSFSHTVGLRRNGTVLAAGENQYGQCDVQSWRNIIGISTTDYYTAGLRFDGTVAVTPITNKTTIGTGLLHDLQTALNETSQWTDIVSISASMNHLVGLKADGTVVAAGINSYGQCDVADWRDIVFICTGQTTTVGIRSDGTVVIAGTIYGQFADETITLPNDTVNALIADLEVVSACCGYGGNGHFIFLCKDGSIYSVSSLVEGNESKLRLLQRFSSNSLS